MKPFKSLLLILAIICCFMAFTGVTASADQPIFTKVIQTKVTNVNHISSVITNHNFLIELGETDYMTTEEWVKGEWDWFNADDGKNDTAGVDLKDKDLSSFLLDKHLSDYNYESMIKFDGVPLSELKVEHPYVLSGNHRQRANTLSINFTTDFNTFDDVLQDVTTFEILAGCQLPTLSRSHLGESELSCIEITETVKYEKRDGKWVYYFEGYEEGKAYVADEKMFKTSQVRKYKGHQVAPTTGFTDFFDGREVGGEYHVGKALASAGNTAKDTIVVVKLVNPIDSKKFNTIVLKVQSNHMRTVTTYNDQNEDLGYALQSFNLNGWSYTTLKLTSSLYADENGLVDTIIFKFMEDGSLYKANDNDTTIHYDDFGNVQRDQFFVMSVSVENSVEKDIVLSDAFFVVETDTTNEITFRFNKQGEDRGDVTLDLSKVTLNGVTLKKILAECKTATAEWQVIGSIFQIKVSLPKSYVGEAQIKHIDQNFNTNNMSVLEGLVFPNGDVLEKTFVCHLYWAEKIVDSDMVEKYDDIKVESIAYNYASSGNIQFVVTFDKKITTKSYVHVCELERWRSKELVAADASYYDAQTSRAFINGGYKSSLLDNVLINGWTIAEWHAQKGVSLTNVQVHYGYSGHYTMDIHFEKASPATFNIIDGLIASGQGLTIEIRQGLKFTTDTKVAKTQTFVLKNGLFKENVKGKATHIYYDGTEVVNGANITVNADVAEESLYVEGPSDYTVSTVTNGNVTEFTVIYDDNQFKFTVTKDFVPTEIMVQMGSSAPHSKNEGQGCNALIPILSVIGGIVVLAGAVVLVMILRRKKENKLHE